MIYDRLRSLSSTSFSPPLSFVTSAKLSREHLHHLGASGMYRSPEEDSDLNGFSERGHEGGTGVGRDAHERRRCFTTVPVTREFITHYTAEELELKAAVAMHFEFVRFSILLPLPVDFSSVINSRTLRRP